MTVFTLANIKDRTPERLSVEAFFVNDRFITQKPRSIYTSNRHGRKH